MFIRFSKACIQLFSIFFIVLTNPAHASNLVSTVAQVKPGVVGVGVYDPAGSPRAKLLGTGFIVAQGIVATNYHVADAQLSGKQVLSVFEGRGQNPNTAECSILDVDRYHDLALLKCAGVIGTKLEVRNADVQEGQRVAFTGFPIGAVLGLYPVTHEGIVSSISPVVIPAPSAKALNLSLIKRLKDPYDVYQLDATAYPGNSGSPVYDPHTGVVIGVINKVFVKESKESLLKDPSGITYAIPAEFLLDLMRKHKL